MSGLNKNTILLTGSTGFVGQALVQYLLQNFNSKIVLCQRTKLSIQPSSERLIIEITDLTNLPGLSKIFIKHKPNHIIHLAGITRLSDGENRPDLAWETNFSGTKKLLKLAEEFGVKTFLFLSSDLARNAKGVIGLTKYLTETSLIKRRNPSPKVLILRLPNVAYTPGSVHTIFERQIDNNQNLSITHGDMSRRFVSLGETIEYIAEVFNNGIDKRVYVIDKAPQKILDLASELISKSGKKLEIKIIGAKAGEKLVEESYSIDEIEHTGFRNLAFLKNGSFEDRNIKAALKDLNSKPSLINKIDLTSL